MIRTMKNGDIPALVEMFQEMHKRSVYATRDEIDVRELKRLLMASIQRNGHKTEGGTCCLVAERQGNSRGDIVGMPDGNSRGGLSGVLIGVLDRVYHILHRLMATDLFFYTTADADPRAAITMFLAFERWAEGNPNVIEIKLGAADAIDPETRVTALYERRGYRRCGFMFERSITR